MELGFSPGDFVLDGDPAPSPKRGRSPLLIFGKFLLCQNGWMHHDAAWYGGRPQPKGLCVQWGPSPSSPKRGRAPAQFSAHVYCGQTAEWIKMALDMEVGRGPGHIVLDGEPSPLLQKGQSPPPNFPPIIVAKRLDESWWHLHGGGPWSKPHCVRWGPSSPPQKGTEPPPIFGRFLLSPNGRMHQDVTWYGGKPQPRRLCVRWGPSFPSPKGAHSPNFWPMSVMAKLLDGLRWHLVWR